MLPRSVDSPFMMIPNSRRGVHVCCNTESRPGSTIAQLPFDLLRAYAFGSAAVNRADVRVVRRARMGRGLAGFQSGIQRDGRVFGLLMLVGSLCDGREGRGGIIDSMTYEREAHAFSTSP
jgi:hypothetical protein